ncbi:MAG: sensor histidine kinase [Planctomycetaceae bacterium]
MRTLELLLFGIATVVDLALLLALLERVNRRRVAAWMKALVGGVTAVHAAIFARLVLEDVAGPMGAAVEHSLVVCICAALLVLPSAMLHAAARLNRTGIAACPRWDGKYLALYMPLLLLPLVAMRVFAAAEETFLQQVGPWAGWYLIWMATANVISIGMLMRLRGRIESPGIDAFLSRLAATIAIITGLCIAYAVVPPDDPLAIPLRLLATLSPLAAALLFVWYSLRGRLLPLVMERTFGYAVILAGILLTHQLLIAPIAATLRAKTGIDFLIIEGILVTLAVLAVPSLRLRVAESLRYLFSSNVFQVRDATRRLSLKLSQHASLDADDLVGWFADELRQSIALDRVTIVLDIAGSAEPRVVCSSATQSAFVCDAPSSALTLIHRAVSQSDRALERGAVPDMELDDAFVAENALIAFPLAYRSVSGTVLLGNRNRSDRLAQEQVYALSIVVDQFAATLHNRFEEALRQRAERKMLQQEKLSVLGLLSGSLAHELRNPLSSMRTIATLASEELGETHSCTQDLQLIISEIDRLTQTTNRLLDFARPEPDRRQLISPDQTIQRIVSILNHLARQYHVETSLKLECGAAQISSNEACLSEIVFNLVKNAIEAVRESEQGKVSICSRQENGHIVVSVHDNGPGIANELRETLFQPFATLKSGGSGLGLYAAAERVRELGGRIEYDCRQAWGTAFEVRIPIASSDENLGH